MKKAFTLIELMVIITFIGILTTIAISALGSHHNNNGESTSINTSIYN